MWGLSSYSELDTFCDACSWVSVLFGCLRLAFKFAESEYVSMVVFHYPLTYLCSTLFYPTKTEVPVQPWLLRFVI
jgi:hypothetical protein